MADVRESGSAAYLAHGKLPLLDEQSSRLVQADGDTALRQRERAGAARDAPADDDHLRPPGKRPRPKRRRLFLEPV